MIPIDFKIDCAVHVPFKMSEVVVPELPASVKSVEVIVFSALLILTLVSCAALSNPIQLLKLNTGACTPKLYMNGITRARHSNGFGICDGCCITLTCAGNRPCRYISCGVWNHRMGAFYNAS